MTQPRPRLGRTACGRSLLTIVPALTTLAASGDRRARPRHAGTRRRRHHDAGRPGRRHCVTSTLRGTAAPTRRAAAGRGRPRRGHRCGGTPSAPPPRSCPPTARLGAAPGAPPTAPARWLRDHAARFGMSAARSTGSCWSSAQRLADSDARAVLFRQEYDGLAPARGGLVTVGVADGQVAYVSSSLARSARPRCPRLPSAAPGLAQGGRRPSAATCSTRRGRRHRHDGRAAAGPDSTVPGFAQEQQVRLRALPLADGCVRPVFEANVVNVAGGSRPRRTHRSSTPSPATCSRAATRSTTSPTTTSSPAPSPPDECGPQARLRARRTTSPGRSAQSPWPCPPTTSPSRSGAPATPCSSPATSAPTPRWRPTPPPTIPAGTYSAQVCPFDPASVVGRPVRPRRQHQRHRGPGLRRRRLPAALALLPRQPDARLPHPDADEHVVGCWSPAR